MERDPHKRNVDLDQLRGLSAEEIAEELECVLASDTYDKAVIGSYLDVLDEKAPVPDIPDVDAAYEQFLTAMSSVEPVSEYKSIPKRPRKRHRWFVGLAAAVVVFFVIAGCTVQLAGVDIVGTIARWTENVFSFGTIRTDGAENNSPDGSEPAGPVQNPDRELTFDSLQDALDYYVITEAKAPGWLPEGYGLTHISATGNYDFGIFSLHAIYEGPDDAIGIGIMRYTDEPSIQAEKSEELVDTFEMNGLTIYVLDNWGSWTFAWCTENFECYIYGADREVLRWIAESMI